MSDINSLPIGGSFVTFGSKRIKVPPELYKAIEEAAEGKTTGLMNVSFVGGSVASVDMKLSKKYK